MEGKMRRMIENCLNSMGLKYKYNGNTMNVLKNMKYNRK